MSTQQIIRESAARAVLAATKRLLGQDVMLSSAVIVGGAALWRLTHHRPTTVGDPYAPKCRLSPHQANIYLNVGYRHLAHRENETPGVEATAPLGRSKHLH
jgi:hypothetical protein